MPWGTMVLHVWASCSYRFRHPSCRRVLRTPPHFPLLGCECCKYSEGEEDALIWKGKADIINHDERLIIDIKTTSDIARFKNSARVYNYDSQAFIYRQFAEQTYTTNGWEFIFVVVCKKSKRIGLYNCSEEFYGRGMQKVVQATEVYKDMFLDPLFEKDKYLLSDTL